MDIREFGRIGDEVVHEVRLATSSGASAAFLTLGALLRDLVVPLGDGTERHVVLGHPTIDGYVANPCYLGVIAGRVANRIGGGRFRLGGRLHETPRNESGVTTLHGGTVGFSQRVWSIAGGDESHVEFALVSEDGDQGFPGRLDVRCRYELRDPAELLITLIATCDAPTPVSLTNHAYFTLDEGGDCRDHLLEIAADFYTPVDAQLVPTGEILSVAGTPFDFREERRIDGDYDINFALRGEPGALIEAVRVSAPDRRLAMVMETNQPGVQLYNAHGLASPHPGLDGRPLRARSAICLEAQGFPDAPNRRHFPSITLTPGETYRHETRYRFVTTFV